MHYWKRRLLFPVMFLRWWCGRPMRVAWAMVCAFAMRDDGDKRRAAR